MRIIVYSAARELLRELNVDDVISMTRKESINGERSLTLRTLDVLAKGMRLVVIGDDRVREWVVTGEDSKHASGASTIGTYECVWSLQADFSQMVVKTMPGTVNPVSAAVALASAFPAGHGWSTGTVTVQTTGGASFWFMSSWEALSTLVEVWGGEIDSEISVTDLGTVTRRVCMYDKMGDQTPHRRFEYGHDMSSVRRVVSEDVMTCRVIPRGAAEETEDGGFGRKITIEDVNDGNEWLQNDQSAQMLAYVVNGVTRYPTQVIENQDMETPADLKAWALSVIDDYTLPVVSYEASVVQFQRAGLDPAGIGLGDAVMCVDKAFMGDGLRIQGRVMEMTVNELDPTDMDVTIGNFNFDAVAQMARTQALASGAQVTADEAVFDASNASKVATNYITFDSSTGLDLSYDGTDASTRVTDYGLEVFDGDGNSALFVGMQNGTPITRIGKAAGSGNVVMKGDGTVDVRSSNSLIAHFGFGETTSSEGGTQELVQAPYYDLGERDVTYIGAYSTVEGSDNQAANFCAHAEGIETQALGMGAHAEGSHTVANWHYAHAEGFGTIAQAMSSHAMGRYNVASQSHMWSVGNGTSAARKDIAYLTTAGALWIAGALTQNSDRRLEEHVSYLGDDAAEFIRQLRPALFVKDGERHVGFYAQDVADADPWGTAIVQEQHTDEGLGFDPLTLDYNALIAPLVAYCRGLEERIEALEKA